MGIDKRASHQLPFRRVFSAESLDTGRLPSTDSGSVSDLALGAHLKLVSARGSSMLGNPGKAPGLCRSCLCLHNAGLGSVLAKDRVQCRDEQFGVGIRKNQRGPKLDYIVIRTIRPGEYSVLPQTVADIRGLHG